MIRLIHDVNSEEWDSAHIDFVRFDTGERLLHLNGYKTISLEENARLRIQEDDSYISRNGNWVREGILYISPDEIYLVDYPPFMGKSKKITNYHKNGNDFNLDPDYVKSLTSMHDSIIVYPLELSTELLGKFSLTKHAFGEYAEDYGNFLKEKGIDELTIKLAELPRGFKPFVRPIWFEGINNNSTLDGSRRFLHCGDLRGIRHKLKPKSSAVYIPKKERDDTYISSFHPFWELRPKGSDY